MAKLIAEPLFAGGCMGVGYNEEKVVNGVRYHIQTQVLREQQLILTTIFQGGAVVYKFPENYADKLTGVNDSGKKQDIIDQATHASHLAILSRLERLIEAAKLAKKQPGDPKAKEARLLKEFLGEWVGD